jgi:hypothetical protein
MRPTSTLAWIHALLRRWVDRRTFEEVIEPTIADIRHEVSEAATTLSRRATVIRGYGSLVRVLFVCGLWRAGSLTHAAGILLVVVASAALLRWASAAESDPKVLNSARLLPIFIAPVVLRLMGAGGRFWRLAVGAFAAGLMTLTLGGGLGLFDSSIPIAVRLARLTFWCLPLALASAATAAAMWRPGSGRRSVPNEVLLAAFAGGLAAAVAFGPVVLWPHGTTPSEATAMLPFYISLFALLFSVTLVPLLLVLRRWIRDRSNLGFAASALSPAVICSSSYLDGHTLRECLGMARSDPWHFLIAGSPFVIGAAVLGWTLSVQTARRLSTPAQRT